MLRNRPERRIEPGRAQPVFAPVLVRLGLELPGVGQRCHRQPVDVVAVTLRIDRAHPDSLRPRRLRRSVRDVDHDAQHFPDGGESAPFQHARDRVLVVGDLAAENDALTAWRSPGQLVRACLGVLEEPRHDCLVVTSAELRPYACRAGGEHGRVADGSPRGRDRDAEVPLSVGPLCRPALAHGRRGNRRPTEPACGDVVDEFRDSVRFFRAWSPDGQRPAGRGVDGQGA